MSPLSPPFHAVAGASGPDTANLVVAGLGGGFSRALVRGFTLADVLLVKPAEGFKYGDGADVRAATFDGANVLPGTALAGPRAVNGRHAPAAMVCVALLTEDVQQPHEGGGRGLLGEHDLTKGNEVFPRSLRVSNAYMAAGRVQLRATLTGLLAHKQVPVLLELRDGEHRQLFHIGRGFAFAFGWR